MKVWVPDVHDITVDILSSILLVDCDFLFPDYESELCDLAHKCCVDIFYSHLSFGVDAASGQSYKI